MTRADPPAIDMRVLVSAEELAALPEFEQRVWGGVAEVVSVNMLVACISEGGVALGAFDGNRVIGAAFGFPARDQGVLHSHYMAVDPAYRRRGLAVELKQRQRTWCLANGYRVMRWTYDPLQLMNGHLNLHVLGAVGVAYHENHYGALGGINGSLPSDRITVAWHLADDTPPPYGARDRWVTVPPFGPDAIRASAPEAVAARMSLRSELQPAMADGWRLVDVDRDQRRYRLAPPT